ncbi:DNA polymerase [Skermanella stibiiresistens SB22]|uniref:DNA polymerase n=1 Tax=Skermanella stibiiresistens SB22 TaxID=1385369 RepID=W9H9Q4_9PROT|nr:uracil-DNA glycosylase [Skermanella stibiiresistens]EWY41437.1 DNA polymerase [Skermanella stibiiresistens SB22]
MTDLPTAGELPFVDYQYPTKDSAGGRIAIIGEAPGAEEARTGRPFVGVSGRMLDENLKSVGLDRATCLVGNTFRHQPPGNKVGHFFSSRTKARKMGVGIAEDLGPMGTSDYCLAQYAGEIEHLRKTLAEIRPAVIIALGRTPLWALTGQSGITALRGQELPCRLLDGAIVVPTFHPSYILRGNRVEEPLFHADVKLAVERAG